MAPTDGRVRPIRCTDFKAEPSTFAVQSTYTQLKYAGKPETLSL